MLPSSIRRNPPCSSWSRCGDWHAIPFQTTGICRGVFKTLKINRQNPLLWKCLDCLKVPTIVWWGMVWQRWKAITATMTPYHSQNWAHLLSLKGAGGSIENLTRSISNARVDLNPHQVDAALFALRSPLTKGAILADEEVLKLDHLVRRVQARFGAWKKGTGQADSGNSQRGGTRIFAWREP